MRRFLALIVVWSCAASSQAANPDSNVIFPMVTTPLGQLRGQTLHSRSGRPYYAYRSIPYAQPPQRFQPPVPVTPWSTILDARLDGAVCPQTNGQGGVMGDENCLTLNVFFPHYDRCQNESSGSGQLPVYVHIHGGAFKTGTKNDFGSKYLLDECIVFVAMNYRLGALGFLTMGDDVIPGNLGLKDQVMALQWVQKYIQYFRGNPAIVNINGISAGGCSVSHHVTSPMSKGLFTSAIASSGSNMNPWAVQEKPELRAQQLAQKLKCDTTTSSIMKDCLSSVAWADIILNQENGEISPYCPTLEPATAVASFQTVNPAILMKSGEFNRVPLITGITLDEGIAINAALILNDPAWTSLFNNSWLDVAPKEFFYEDLNLSKTEKDRISNEIRKFYFGDKDIGLETRQEFVNLWSDRGFVQGVLEMAERHSKFAPAYSYVMTYKGGFSFCSFGGYEIPVMSHGDDGQYLFFPSTILQEKSPGTDQFKFSQKIVGHFTNFAKTGQPNEPWTQTTGDKIHQLDLIEGDLEGYLKERQTFWRNLGLYKYDFNEL